VARKSTNNHIKTKLAPLQKGQKYGDPARPLKIRAYR
jgi:hypothetical protein